jgi:hypothetical protein
MLVTGANRLGCQHDSFESGATNFVNGEGWDLWRDAAVDSRLARGGLSGASLNDLSHNDFVDICQFNTRPLDCFAHRVCP